VPYAVENALFQWEDGDRRLRTAQDPERRFAGTDSAYVVDAAFMRYARFASDFGGGKRRDY
jgi:hypothetical protein